MSLKLDTAPTTEPISLLEAKTHLRLDSGSFGDNVTVAQSIKPGSHAIAAAYTLIGSSVNVLGYNAVVVFNAGTNGAGGTVDVKLQESDDDTTFTDVASGAFTQVTTANDNAVYEKAYTGTKTYLRVVTTVAGAACEFSVDILTYMPYSTEDTYISSLITAARRYCEGFQNRAYMEQTWELWLDSFPERDYIQMPLPPLSSVTSVKYYDTDDTEATMSSDDYYVDTNSTPGRLCLNYGATWPTITLRKYNGVCITFVAGAALAASVDQRVKQAMLLLIGDYYQNREAGKASEKIITAVERLLWFEREI